MSSFDFISDALSMAVKNDKLLPNTMLLTKGTIVATSGSPGSYRYSVVLQSGGSRIDNVQALGTNTLITVNTVVLIIQTYGGVIVIIGSPGVLAGHAATHYLGGNDAVTGTPTIAIPNATNTNADNTGPGLATGNHQHQITFGTTALLPAAGNHGHATTPHAASHYLGGTDAVTGTPTIAIPNATNTNADNAGPGLATGNHQHQITFGTTALLPAAGNHDHGATIVGTVRSTVNQSITAAQDNNEITLQFNTVVENVGLTWDGTNYEWVALTAGVYSVQAEVKWENTSVTGIRVLHIYKNPRATPSAAVLLSDPHVTPGGPDAQPSAQVADYEYISCHATCGYVRLAVNDRIGCSVLKRTNNATPVAVSVLAGAQFSPVMRIVRIGA